jgi:hypothetical protein
VDLPAAGKPQQWFVLRPWVFDVNLAGLLLRAATPAPGLPAPPGGAAQPGPPGITVTIWHNVAPDDQGRHTAMLDGYQPCDPVVAVFTYQTDAGRPAEEIADEAYDIFTGHPRDPAGADLACAYYGRRLRPLSFPEVAVLWQAVLVPPLQSVARPSGRPRPACRNHLRTATMRDTAVTGCWDGLSGFGIYVRVDRPRPARACEVYCRRRSGVADEPSPAAAAPAWPLSLFRARRRLGLRP